MAKIKTIILFFILSVLKTYGYNTDINNEEDSLSSFHKSAIFFAGKGDFAQAIKFEEKLVAFYKKQPLSQEYVFSLNDLAAYYSDSGEFEKALEIGCKVIELVNDSIEIDSVGKYEIFQHQAIYYENIGDHEKSQEYGHLALDIAKKMPSDTWAYPRSLVFLAFSYSELGNYDNAIKLCLEAKSVYDNLDKRPDDYGYVFNDLGAYYCEKGDIERALDYGWTYVNFLKERELLDKQKYVVALNNLARYYAIRKDNQKAIELSYQAWLTIEENNLQNAYLKGRTMEHLATFHANIDEFEKAMNYCEKSISFFKEIWATDRPGLINEYRRHLSYSLLTSNLFKREKEILEVGNNISNIVLTAFSFLPSSGRHMYWKNYSSWYEKELPIYIHTLQTDTLLCFGYNSLLLSKGILLNSEVEIKQLIESANDSTLIRKFNDLQNLQLSLLNSNEIQLNDSICNYLNDQESYLVSSCKKYGDYTKQLKVHWRDVQKQLLEKEIAIEFSRIERDGEYMYVAYTLTQNNDVPHYYSLCNEDDLKGDYDKLYNLVWKPIEKELAGMESVYFSPVGELHRIAIESASYSKEETMADKFKMYRLSSTRELVRNKQIRPLNKTVLFGGLDYYTTPYYVDSVYVNKRKETNLYSSTRSFIDVDRNEVGQLNGSREEVLIILHLLPDGSIVEAFLDQEGTEEAFKTLSGKNIDLLHISTHGYYLPKSRFYNANRSMQIKQNTISFEDESLIRSGLYFAGSNAFLLRKELLNYFEDGIATASEIAKLDFQDLDLVVLSACETGLGDLEGDGVFGLQRGFKKAGARSLLMSLQKVNDYATRLLMVEFYKNYFGGRSKRDSLNRAQNYVKHFKDNDGNDVFSAPSYWASFVLLDAIDEPLEPL